MANNSDSLTAKSVTRSRLQLQNTEHEQRGTTQGELIGYFAQAIMHAQSNLASFEPKSDHLSN